jgi:hypothetical protein
MNIHVFCEHGKVLIVKVVVIMQDFVARRRKRTKILFEGFNGVSLDKRIRW